MGKRTDIKIKNAVYKLKKEIGSTNIRELCKMEGINIIEKDYSKDCTALFANLYGNYYIYVNANYSREAKDILIAHELGHILLGHEGVNHFGSDNIDLEREADLFALYFYDDIFKEDNIKFENMNAYLIRKLINKELDI